MRHFIVTITYLAPIGTFGEAVQRHRAYLDLGYHSGLLLMSGPKTPPIGGIVVARAGSEAEIRRFFDQDPYKLENLATHEFTEFSPVKHQALLADWVASATSGAPTAPV